MENEILLSGQVFYDCNLPEEIEGYKLIGVSDDIYKYKKINKKFLNLGLDMNYICKQTIKQRKAIYGNSFSEIAKLQSEYYDREITPKDVAMTLAILKKVRINFIKSKLKDLKEKDYITQIEVKELNNGLEDSIKDYNNYLWIATNYDEYEKL